MIARTTKNEMTDTQVKIAGKIAREWPAAKITEYDAGCFCATVEADANAISHMFPSPRYGVVIGNTGKGKSRIDF
jgi:hypothetical protein